MGLSGYDREHIGDLVAGHGDWFTAQLIRLCAKADAMNLIRLSRAFPDEVQAYVKWRDGFRSEQLQALADTQSLGEQ